MLISFQLEYSVKLQKKKKNILKYKHQYLHMICYVCNPFLYLSSCFMAILLGKHLKCVIVCIYLYSHKTNELNRYKFKQLIFTICKKRCQPCKFGKFCSAQTPSDSSWTETIKVTSVSPYQVDSSDALTNFKNWVQSTSGSLPGHDHAMLFTR